MVAMIKRWWNTRQVRRWQRGEENAAVRDDQGRDHLDRQRAGIRDTGHAGF